MVTVRLRVGTKYAYKFICDESHWKYDPSQPWERDGYANINNIALVLPRSGSVVSHQAVASASPHEHPTPSPPTQSLSTAEAGDEPRRLPRSTSLQANAESFLAWATPSEAIRAAKQLPGIGGAASTAGPTGSERGALPVDPLVAAQRADERIDAAEFGLDAAGMQHQLARISKSRSAAEFGKLMDSHGFGGSDPLSRSGGVFGAADLAASLMGIPGLEADGEGRDLTQSLASDVSGGVPRTASHPQLDDRGLQPQLDDPGLQPQSRNPRWHQADGSAANDDAGSGAREATSAGHGADLGLSAEPPVFHQTPASSFGSVYGLPPSTSRHAATESGVAAPEAEAEAAWSALGGSGRFRRRHRVESPAANLDLSRRLAEAVAPGRSGAEACLERGTTVVSSAAADLHAAAADRVPSGGAFRGVGGRTEAEGTALEAAGGGEAEAGELGRGGGVAASGEGVSDGGAAASAAIGEAAVQTGRPPRPAQGLAPATSSRLSAKAAEGTSRLFSRGKETGTAVSSRREGKLVLAMVGLPARGKTSIAFKLRRHLNWMGMRTEIFNVGNYRRKLLGTGQSHAFFDPTNRQAMAQRHAMADAALEDMVAALKGGLDVAIFDATNTTRSRREWLRHRLHEEFSDAVDDADSAAGTAAGEFAPAPQPAGSDGPAPVAQSEPLHPRPGEFAGPSLDLAQHGDADGTRASLLAAAAADAGTTDCGKQMMIDAFGAGGGASHAPAGGAAKPSAAATQDDSPPSPSCAATEAVVAPKAAGPAMAKPASSPAIPEGRGRRRASTSGSGSGVTGVRTESRCQLVFIESICTDESIIRANVRETKLKSPDYKGVGEADAVADFLRRIGHYVAVYEPVEDSEGAAYLKLIDVGRKIVAHSMSGFLKGRLLFFLSNLRITPKPIWVTRHGESEFNVRGLIGGDSNLSSRGIAYAKRLAAYMDDAYPPHVPLTVWTSTLRRTQQTASFLRGRRPIAWRNLDEIDAGNCDGRTYEWIAKNMPKEYEARKADKYGYRYPQGESYQDLAQRLEPIMMEVERMDTPILIIAHQAVLRVLLGYLNDKEPSQCPSGSVPLHTLIQLWPKAYGVEEKRVKLG